MPHETTVDIRRLIDCRCAACGMKGTAVQWAAFGSSYENGHLIDGSVPDVCGPMVLAADYDKIEQMDEDDDGFYIPHDLGQFIRDSADRFVDALDLLRHGVGA